MRDFQTAGSRGALRDFQSAVGSLMHCYTHAHAHCMRVTQYFFRWTVNNLAIIYICYQRSKGMPPKKKRRLDLEELEAEIDAVQRLTSALKESAEQCFSSGIC